MSYLEELLPEFRKGAKIRRRCWDEDNYLVLFEEYIIADAGNIYEFCSQEFLVDDWELYQEPQPDWDHIIKNKCLCWFWDIYGEDFKNLGTLDCITEKGKFKKHDLTCWSNCRPVRRDEVTFYEDQKDE